MFTFLDFGRMCEFQEAFCFVTDILCNMETNLNLAFIRFYYLKNELLILENLQAICQIDFVDRQEVLNDNQYLKIKASA